MAALLFYFTLLLICLHNSSSLLNNIDPTNADGKHDAVNLRLPNATKPIDYNLTISIDEKAKRFSGTTNIRIVTISSTRRIVLHANKLNIRKVDVYQLNPDINNISIDHNTHDKSDSWELLQDMQYEIDERYNGSTHFLFIQSKNSEFEFESTCQYLLSIEYEGKMELKQTKGIYLSQPESFGGESELPIITTQFEPTFARRAFPCYDEPHLKARFRLTLIHSSVYQALSNMPLDGEPIRVPSNDVNVIAAMTSQENELNVTIVAEPVIGRIQTKFMETPLMSTYLVAFVLHYFEKVSHTHNNVTHSVYYKHPGLKARALYTVDKSVELLTAMENYFKVNYPLSKLDHMGLPTAYGHAMENWGLILYQEDKYLMDWNCGSYQNLKTITTVAHEMVHQWFGNLVSPKWWSYIWLNEGFATYYSYFIMKQVFPECLDDYFYHYDSLSAAFSAPSKRPLTIYLTKEDDITAAFDTVSYNKGAAVIRMISAGLTEETFQKGIRNYLQKFQYDSVTEDDLIECLEKAALQDNRKYFNEAGFLSDYIKTWTQNRGFPELTVVRNYTTNQVLINQSPIAYGFEKKWYIPISIVTAQSSNSLQNDEKIDLILPPVENFILDLNQINYTRNLMDHDWMLVNNREIGLYNVDYDSHTWKLIVNTLRTNMSGISVINRNQIIRDLFIRFFHDNSNIELLFEALLYLKNETEVLPWYEVIERLTSLEEGFQRCNPKFKEFLHDVMKPITRYLLKQKSVSGATVQSDLNSKIEETQLNDSPYMAAILKLACSVDVEECLEESYKNIKCLLAPSDFKQNFVDILSECYSAANFYCGGIKKASPEEFKMILERVATLEPDLVWEMSQILQCTENPEHLELLLNLILDLIKTTNHDSDVTPLYRCFYDIGKVNKFNLKSTLQFILQNTDVLKKDAWNFNKLIERLRLHDLTREFDDMQKKIISKVGINSLNLQPEDGKNSYSREVLEISGGEIMDLLNRKLLENCDMATNWLANYKIESNSLDTNTIIR